MRTQTNATIIVETKKKRWTRCDREGKEEKKKKNRALRMLFMHHHTCTRLNEYGIFGLVKMARCVWWAAVWRRGRRCWWATKDNHLSMILITITSHYQMQSNRGGAMVVVRIRRARTWYDLQEVHFFIRDGAWEMAEALQLRKVRFGARVRHFGKLTNIWNCEATLEQFSLESHHLIKHLERTFNPWMRKGWDDFC